MIIRDRSRILNESIRILNYEYPGLYPIINADGDKYKGEHCSLNCASMAVLDAGDKMGIYDWKKEVDILVNSGITLNYIVDLRINPSDKTDFNEITMYALNQFGLKGGIHRMTLSEEIPVGKIEVILICAQRIDSVDKDHSTIESYLDSYREEILNSIDFSEFEKVINL